MNPLMRRAIPIAALLLSACGGGGGGGGSSSGTGGSTPVPSTCPIPAVPTTATWSGHIYPLLHSATCGSATTACHGSPSASGRLDFSADALTLFNALVGRPSTTFNVQGWAIITAGDSSRSWLYEKVRPAAGGQPGLIVNNPVGSQMPLGGSLCTATTDTLRIWIDQGAQNN